MGERTTEKFRCRGVERVLEELAGRGFKVEAAIIFGSWARSGGGDWSDLDVLVVTDDVRSTPILDRFKLAAELRTHRVDLFLYTFEELKSMAMRGNPLALSALIEGVPIVSSPRVEELIREARRTYTRRGRTWTRREAT